MKTNNNHTGFTFCSATSSKFRLRFVCIHLILFFCCLFHAPVFAQQRLDAGDWKGSFLSHDGTRYKIAYKVGYSEEDENKAMKINMIYLDLEPRSEFTFELSDIEIDSDYLKFIIVKEFETKLCNLKFKTVTTQVHALQMPGKLMNSVK